VACWGRRVFRANRAGAALPRPTAQYAARSAVTFVVTDDCGDWPSFVGGGADAF